jgi:hypothetical protein
MLAHSRPCILVVVRDQTLKADIGGFWPVMFVRFRTIADSGGVRLGCDLSANDPKQTCGERLVDGVAGAGVCLE